MDASAVDTAAIVPGLGAGDALRFAVFAALAVGLPGLALRRLAGLRPGNLPERWALTGVLGAVWTSAVYFALGLAGQERFLLATVELPVVWLAVRHGRRWLAGVRREWRGLRAGWSPLPAAGLLLIGLFAAHYLARVASCVEYGPAGLRLFGAFYSDKMTNMSPCAALLHGVPPVHLRFAGAGFPYHYFPHVFVAAASRAAGIDYVNGFWFYAAALGIAVTGLAVLGFCRRKFRSYAPGCAALALYGLTQFQTEAKPLDLSIALALLGLTALDRHWASGRIRWGVLAVGLWATMPLYEAFHAAALLAGLALWWIAGLGRGRRETLARTAIAGPTILAAVLAVQVACLGQRSVLPTRVIVQNTYALSYKHEWFNLLRESPDGHPWLARILYWKRGKVDFSPALRDRPEFRARPGIVRRAAAEVIYYPGLIGYFFLRFVNIAVFGVVALAALARAGPGRWRTSDGLVASIAAAGFGIPAVVAWGHRAGGQWWESPNVYRLPTCAYLLLVLVGAGAMLAALRSWRRPRSWALVAVLGWQAWVLASAALAPVTTFHFVPRDRLAALAVLRTRVPFGEVVIHPWADDLIRDVRQPDRVAWVYKRHFTLGSNLAGQQMYYEGREDHLFIGGFLDPDAVYRRRELRRRFYDRPDRATLDAVLGEGRVAWVVADREHAAPAEVRRLWPVEYANAGVTIYHRSAAAGPGSPMAPRREGR